MRISKISEFIAAFVCYMVNKCKHNKYLGFERMVFLEVKQIYQNNLLPSPFVDKQKPQ
jgi:hypothetical protein